jgi:hypothetical protein
MVGVRVLAPCGSREENTPADFMLVGWPLVLHLFLDVLSRTAHVR